MKEPCIDCPDKVIDNYGYYCDISCGRRTAWLNYQAGLEEVVKWIQLNKAEPQYRVKRLDGTIDHIASDVLWLDKYSWEIKLKEWGYNEYGAGNE